MTASAIRLDAKPNFEQLCATCAHSKIMPDALRGYIDGLIRIEPSEEFYGEYAPAARILLDARITELEARYANDRPVWEKNLAELRESYVIDPAERHPANGPAMLSNLRVLEEALADGFKEASFGDLTDVAVEATKNAVVAIKDALSEIALMVVDPDSVDMACTASVPMLELALAASKRLPLSADAFFGNEDRLTEARRRHPIWIKKQEELLAKRRKEEGLAIVGEVEQGIEARDEKEHRNRVHDAGLTADQRGARQARMHEASGALYDLVRRMTEIAHLNEAKQTGAIDANALLEVTHRAEAMVARIEGRAN